MSRHFLRSKIENYTDQAVSRLNFGLHEYFETTEFSLQGMSAWLLSL
jgi:hypothetical protein